jgi:hypothetical protein
MTEKFGLDGIWEDLNNNLIVDVETYEDNSSASELPLVTKFTVTNGAPKSDSKPKIFFEEVVLTVGIPPDLHLEKHTDLASGESFTYEHRSRYSDLGRIVFSVEGKVSPSHLLRVKNEARNIPSRVARLSMASYVEVLKDINLHKWLRDVIEVLPIPSADANQPEIEALQGKLRIATKEIGDTKTQLENILNFIIRTTDKDKSKMNQLSRLVEEYLTHTAQGCSELSKMLDTYNTRTLESSRQNIVSRLSQEAAKLDQASAELA